MSARSPIARCPGRVPFSVATTPVLPTPLRHLQAPGAQPLGHQGGGAQFLEPDFRVLVDVVADVDQLRLVGLQRVDQGGCLSWRRSS